jgi:hypothetical protein
VLLGAALVVLLTWPTVPRASTTGRVDSGDGRFSIWNVAWIDHALLTSPAGLLNANIFYPHTGTLAYSELNLVAGVLGLPWFLVTGSALAALNGAAASALLLAFVTMAALVRRLTGSEGAGLVSATTFTFCPYVTAHTAHIQLLMIFALPAVLLAFHRLADRSTGLDGVWLGLALSAAALACGYYGVFAGLALGVAALLWRRPSGRYVGSLGIAAVTAAACVGPVFAVFKRARAASGAAPTPVLGDISGWSANLASYAASSALAHEWWLPALRRFEMWNEVLFPGFVVLALAGVALATVRRRAGDSQSAESRRVVRVYLAMGALAFWASFGPAAGLWSWLGAAPGMAYLRAPARLGLVVAFALAVIGGVGAARVASGRRWVFGVLVVLAALELGVKTDAWGFPSWPLAVAPAVPPAYERLAQMPPGVVVEFPFPYVSSNYHNHSVAMYWSTVHWKPLVNGYSDVIPPDFDAIAVPINYFPDPASFEIMRARQVRYVVWHIDAYRGDGQRTIEDRLRQYAPFVRPVLTTDDVWLYEITGWPGRP